MSLVGTRPPTVDEWDKYELHHRARLATKPGLTGMWQVSGRSNITDLLEIVVLRQLKLISKLILQFSFRIMENWIRLTIYFLSKTIRRSIMFQIIQEIVTAVLIN